MDALVGGRPEAQPGSGVGTTCVAVVGAGQMGSGIAYCALQAGLKVVLTDISAQALDGARARIKAQAKKSVEKGSLSREQAEPMDRRLVTCSDYGSLVEAQLVVEAATERVDIKAEILFSVEEHASEDALIATNTSSISITKLARSLRNPSRFAGLHFFNPVHAMPLVEVVPGVMTSDSTLWRLKTFATGLGKRPILVKNAPGFVVNRLLCPMLNEAILALQDGIASANDIDAAMKLGANHPMGPLALADLIGLDTVLSIMEILHQQFGEPKYRPARLLRELVEAGCLGRKSGRGFHNYLETQEGR